MLNKMLMLLVGLIFLFIPPIAIAQMPMPTMVPAPSSSMILGWDAMEAVDGPFVGDANPIRGVSGGGRPWMIDEAQGELDSDGMVAIKVEGLVLVETGMNPSTDFKGIVSCLTTDDLGGVTYVNLETAFFRATEDGDAEIVDKVMLPEVCLAPIVFVAGTSGNWFAITGYIGNKEEADEPEEMEVEDPVDVDELDELDEIDIDELDELDEVDIDELDEVEEVKLDVPEAMVPMEAAMVGGSSSDERDDKDREKIIRFNKFDDVFDNDLEEFLFFNDFDEEEFFDEEFEEEFDSDSSSSTESDSSSSLGLARPGLGLGFGLGLRRAFLPRQFLFNRFALDPFDRFPFDRRIIFDRDQFFPRFGLEDDDFLFEDFDEEDD